MAVVYHKLVRDKIPEIIRAKGETPVTRALTEAEFAFALAAKLVEEAKEAQEAIQDPAVLAKELGDVLEVIEAICAAAGLDRQVIERVRAKRRQERGGFAKKLFLESVA